MSMRIVAAILSVLVLQLPPPFDTPWFRKPTRTVPMPDGHRLTAPARFTVSIFADTLQLPRFMTLAPNGDVFVAEPFRNAATITVLRDADKNGVAELRETFAAGLNRPFGLAFWKNYLYVGNNDSIVRFAYTPGQLKAAGAPEKIVDLPPSDAALDQDTAIRLKIDVSQTRGYNHWTRNIIFNPAGTKMYVTVGSATNATPESDARRAAINEYNPDGSGHRVFASGLRNPVGLAYFPGTNTLWTAVNERDQLGDDLVPDYITSVSDGAFYGWPYSYIGKNLDPTVTVTRPDLVATAIAPDVLLPAHSAALGLIFYTGSQFPADVPEQRVRGVARIDQPIEAVRLRRRARPISRWEALRTARRIPVGIHRRGTMRKNRRGAGQSGCYSCRTGPFCCQTMAAIACGG